MDKERKEILKNLSILVVEDNDKLRKKLIQALSLLCGSILEASNGEDAIELFNKYSPRIIITDIKMPLMDGLRFTEYIRRIDDLVPIIVISAYSEKETLLQLIPLHITEFLMKPFEFNQLENVLFKAVKVIMKLGLIEVKFSEDVTYSFTNKHILNKGYIHKLQPKEILLLELLLKKRDQLVTKEEIEYTVYEDKIMSYSAISNLVSKLRKKLDNRISTITGSGFMLVSK